MDFIKIVIRRNVAKRNKTRLRAQPDLKNLFYGDWGNRPNEQSCTRVHCSPSCKR